MRHVLPILGLAFACVACSSKEQKTEENTDLAKHTYAMEVNPVDVIRLERKIFNKQLISNGKLSAKLRSVIGFPSQGEVLEVHVKNGDRVEPGAILAVQNTTAARSALKQAEQAMDKARIELLDNLIGAGYVGSDTSAVPKEVLRIAKIRSNYSTAQLNLEDARTKLANSTLRSPFVGKVANLETKAYEVSKPEFCAIINDDVLEVNFSILENEAPYVKQGQRVRIATFVNPEKYIVGELTQINPMIDEKGLVALRAEVRNDGRLLDGMNVKVMIEHDIPNQLVVPKSAVLIRDNLNVLFRYNQGKSMWTYVHILNENGDSYVVTANEERAADLNVGDSIITSGNLNLADNSNVTLKK